MVKNIVLGFMLYMFLGNCSFAQTVWVPVYQPQPVVIQAPPMVVVQKEFVPIYVAQPYYGWVPCWRRWWCGGPQYQWIYVGY